MKYMTVTEAAQRWGISDRRVRLLCSEGRIDGFEGIHPFIDGNGRTGRLLLNLELIREGYPPINIKFADRRRYYDAFDAYYHDGSPDAMIELVGGYVEERLREYLRIIVSD